MPIIELTEDMYDAAQDEIAYLLVTDAIKGDFRKALVALLDVVEQDRRKRKREGSQSSRAQSFALTRLTREFPDRFRELYDEETAAKTAARPQTRAKTRLCDENRDRYREIYAEEAKRLGVACQAVNA